MRKLLLMSLIVVPVLMPILLSGDPDAQRGRKRTVWGIVIFDRDIRSCVGTGSVTSILSVSGQ